LEKSVNASQKDWYTKPNEVLWVYKTAFKMPIGLSPFQLVYDKACHLLVAMEHKAYWDLKLLNFDSKAAREKRHILVHGLEELRLNAYSSSKIYKERAKRYHDKNIINKEFHSSRAILLFNSRLRLFHGKLKAKWS